MRIIAGSLKGRKLSAPKNLPVRPTTNQSKEALFNILSNNYELEGMRVMDLFSGTGNISFEFISRGCLELVSIDMNANCINYQKMIAKQFDLHNFYPFKNDVFKGVYKAKGTFDLIFADPPYQLKKIPEIPQLIIDAKVLNEGGLLIVEHGKETIFDKIKPTETREYGSVNFSFFHL
jgi:16S rRNA (guanine(966)-N(2))-methyltransferase RsmD